MPYHCPNLLGPTSQDAGDLPRPTVLSTYSSTTTTTTTMGLTWDCGQRPRNRPHTKVNVRNFLNENLKSTPKEDACCVCGAVHHIDCGVHHTARTVCIGGEESRKNVSMKAATKKPAQIDAMFCVQRTVMPCVRGGQEGRNMTLIVVVIAT